MDSIIVLLSLRWRLPPQVDKLFWEFIFLLSLNLFQSLFQVFVLLIQGEKFSFKFFLLSLCLLFQQFNLMLVTSFLLVKLCFAGCYFRFCIFYHLLQLLNLLLKSLFWTLLGFFIFVWLFNHAYQFFILFFKLFLMIRDRFHLLLQWEQYLFLLNCLQIFLF